MKTKKPTSAIFTIVTRTEESPESLYAFIMRMKDFVELENEFDNVKGDSLATIRYFEKNKEAIDYLDDSVVSNRSFKLKLYGDYGIGLAVSGNINKALTVLDDYIPAFEKESEEDQELLSSPYYEHLLWTYGYSLHDAKRFKDAERVFNKLLKQHPDNSKYKNWFVASKTNRHSTIKQALWTACFLLLATDFLFGKDMGLRLKALFWITAAITLTSVLSLELYHHFIKRKFE